MRNKVKIVVAIGLVIVLIMNTFSLAVSEGQVKLKTSNNSVKKGDTFTVTVSEELSDGATSFQSDLKYNQSILELSSINTASGWNYMGETESDRASEEVLVLFAFANSEVTSGDVLTLTFKVKDDYTTEAETKVEVVNSILYKVSNEEVNADDTSISIKVNEASNNQGTNNTSNNTTNNTTNNIINNTSNNRTNNTSNNTTNNTSNNRTNNTTNNTSNNRTNNTSNNTSNNRTNNTTNNTSNNTTNNTSNNRTNNTSNNTTNNTSSNSTSSTLPKTGSGRAYILLIIAGLLGVAFISYKGYEKYKGI